MGTYPAPASCAKGRGSDRGITSGMCFGGALANYIQLDIIEA